MTGSDDWVLVGEQVRDARLSARLTQAELGRLVGLDRTMVAKIEAGTRQIDALELVSLSRALAVPIDHLLSPRLPVLSRRDVLTEDSDTEMARESQRLEIALAAWVRDVRQVVDLGVFTPPPQRTYSRSATSQADARDAAQWLRSSLGYGDEPIDTLMEFSERCGQLVLVTDVPGDGASVVDGDVAAAVVSLAGDPGRRRATAAHELGHLVLGDEYSSDLGVHASRAEREQAIDAFAAELLLPLAVFDRWGRTALRREDLIGLAATYRTSWSLALRQAHQADVITTSTRRRWSQTNPTRAELCDAVGWAPQPDLETVRVPPGYSHGVMTAWRQHLVTSARAVELLHGQIALDDLPTRDDLDETP